MVIVPSGAAAPPGDLRAMSGPAATVSPRRRFRSASLRGLGRNGTTVSLADRRLRKVARRLRNVDVDSRHASARAKRSRWPGTNVTSHPLDAVGTEEHEHPTDTPRASDGGRVRLDPGVWTDGVAVPGFGLGRHRRTGR